MNVVTTAVALVIAAVLAYRAVINKVTIRDSERGVKYVRGRVVGVLGAGRYRFNRFATEIRVLDIRPRIVSINGQEVLTADGVPIKVTLYAEYGLNDVAKAVQEVADFEAALYARVQIALRSITASLTVDQILEQRQGIDANLVEGTKDHVSQFGIDLQSVSVKDIMFAGELKRMFAQVVEARQAGLAALERARGETAAMRSMANAARMMNDNRSLADLRMMQVLENSYGNTYVLGVSDTSILPRK